MSKSKRTTFSNRPIQPLKKTFSADPKSKRGKAMRILLASKNTDDALPKLKRIGANGSFIRFAIDSGLIELGKEQAAA